MSVEVVSKQQRGPRQSAFTRMWLRMILLSSRRHTYPSVVGVGHDLPLCCKRQILFEGHGVAAHTVQCHSPKQRLPLQTHTLWSVLSDGDQLPKHNLIIPVDYIQAHLAPLVPLVQRDTHNSCLYLRLSFLVLLFSVAL